MVKEEEKIFAGKLFDTRSQELRNIKHKAYILCQKFNSINKNRFLGFASE